MDTLATLETLRILAARCRRAQREFFHGHSSAALREARDLERRLDAFLADIDPDKTPPALLQEAQGR